VTKLHRDNRIISLEKNNCNINYNEKISTYQFSHLHKKKMINKENFVIIVSRGLTTGIVK